MTTKERLVGLADRVSATGIGRCVLAVLYQGVYRPLTWPRRLYIRCEADSNAAQLVCTNIDRWFGGICCVLYTSAVTVLLFIQTLVGDHKLMMMGDKPGNM
jgi:hypothetical protein